MVEKKYDWTYFKKRIYINNSSKQELFRKWASPGGITEWFIEFAKYEGSDGIIRKPDEVVQAGFAIEHSEIVYGGSGFLVVGRKS